MDRHSVSRCRVPSTASTTSLLREGEKHEKNALGVKVGGSPPFCVDLPLCVDCVLFCIHHMAFSGPHPKIQKLPSSCKNQRDLKVLDHCFLLKRRSWSLDDSPAELDKRTS